MRVRPANLNDAGTIAELNVVVQQLHHDADPVRFKPPDPSFFVETVREWLASNDVSGFIAVDDQHAVGYVLAVRHRRPENALTKAVDFIELDQIAVLPQWEGKGVGRALAERVLDLARELGVAQVDVSVSEFNERAQRLFASLGFVPTQQRMTVQMEASRPHGRGAGPEGLEPKIS